MGGVYGHITPAMRAALTDMLQDRREASFRDRARFAPRSIVPALDALLVAWREPPHKIGSHSVPTIGHQTGRAPRREEQGCVLTW